MILKPLDKIEILSRLFNSNKITLEELFCILRPEAGYSKQVEEIVTGLKNILSAERIMEEMFTREEFSCIKRDFSQGQIKEIVNAVLCTINH